MLGSLRSRRTMARIARWKRSGISGDGSIRHAATLLIHQQAELVAQIQLNVRRLPAEGTNHVESRDFAVEQVAPRQVGVVRYEDAHRGSRIGLPTLQQNPPTVEAKVAVLEAEIAEPAAHRSERRLQTRP